MTPIILISKVGINISNRSPTGYQNLKFLSPLTMQPVIRIGSTDDIDSKESIS